MAWIDFSDYQELRSAAAPAGHQMGAQGFVGKFAHVQAAIRQDVLAAEREAEEREAQRLASIRIQEREAQSRNAYSPIRRSLAA